MHYGRAKNSPPRYEEILMRNGLPDDIPQSLSKFFERYGHALNMPQGLDKFYTMYLDAAKGICSGQKQSIYENFGLPIDMPHNLDKIMAMTSKSMDKPFDLQHYFKEKKLV